MEGPLLLLLYGLSSWGAALNLPAWVRALVRRWRSPRPKPWWRHDGVPLPVGLTLLSAGVAGLSGVRLYGAILGGEPLTVPSAWGILFIGFMASAEPFFLLVDEIHARAEGRRSVIWRLYWAGALGAAMLFLAVTARSLL